MNNEVYKHLSILIIEDDDKARNYLNDILSLHFQVIYTAKDGCEGLELFQQYYPNILLTDIKMPCMDGLEVISTVKEQRQNILTFVCTAFSNKEYLLSAIDIKVDAYFIKPLKINQLLDKIQTHFHDEKSLLEQKHSILSKREYEVFLDIANGIKRNDIATKYNIKPKTVGTYRKRILEKMNFSSNADIITYVITNQLI